ncbi:MAG: cell division protein CrgA, partial [Nakamurella sp.]
DHGPSGAAVTCEPNPSPSARRGGRTRAHGYTGGTVPKSKVRKKAPTATSSRATQTGSGGAGAATATTKRVKVAGPSSPVYIGIMLGLMLLGLAWLVVNYLWGASIPFMTSLGSWNFLIGFVLMIAGLVMAMRWR